MKSGFTLVELMIVVVIIGILAAIAIPKFGTVKKQAMCSSCRSNMRVLAAAESMYYGLEDCYTASAVNLQLVQDNAPLLACPFDAAVYVFATPGGPDTYSVTCAGAVPVPHGSILDGISSWQ